MSAVEDREITTEAVSFEDWVVLELLGHRRLGGYVREQQIAGAAFLRIDIPMTDGSSVTQFYAPGAVYAITPTTEAVAREIAKQAPASVNRWDISALLPTPERVVTYSNGDEYGEEGSDDYPF